MSDFGPPIPSPNTERAIFQTTFWNQFALSSLMGLFVGLPLFFLVERRASEPVILLLSVANGLAFGAIITWINILVTPVVTNSSHLEGRTFWGSKVQVAWNEIGRIKPTRFFWLRYLKVYSAGTKLVIWFPLFLKDMKSFQHVLAKYTTPEHPLRKALEEEI